ncbi:uncharacterized protein OCT59_024443 [Rhizophagus irregularis]|nr:hypothetical protein OCT59_024443 [Rhizophagus irregularis]
MEQEINEDDTVSNNDQESLLDSSLQVPRSDIEKNLFANKVRDMMNNGYSFGNDKIVDESIDTIHNNNVHNSDIDEQNDTSNSEDDDTSDSQVKNYDDIPSTPGHNRIDKEKEYKSNYREQKDELTHRPNYQDDDYNSTDEETKKQSSKSSYAVGNRRETSDDENDDNDHDDNSGDDSNSRYVVKNRKKFEISDDNGNDDNDFDDNIGDNQVKNNDYYEDDIPSSSGHNRIDKKDEFTRRQKNKDSDDDSANEEIKMPISKSRYAERNRRETSDDENGNDDNDYDDNISDSQVKNYHYHEDVIPSTSGHNRIDKEKEFESNYREQKDEFTRRLNYQDSDDDSANEEIKMPISKSRYVVKNRKKFEISDNDNGNDDNDLDDNIGVNQVKNDDYYEDVIPSSSGHNRIDKKKEFESDYREQKDEFTRRLNYQDSDDDSANEEIKMPISKSRYVVKNRKKFEISDNDNGNDDNDLDDNIGDNQVKNNDYYEDDIPSSPGHNRIDKKKEFESYYREQKDEFTRRQKNQDGSDDSTDEKIKKQISKSRYAVGNRKISDDENENTNNDKEPEFYGEQMDETTRYPKHKIGQHLSMHDGNQKKLDNTSYSSQDENDNYEEQIDETTRYPKNKNNQSLSIHGGNQKKLVNTSDSSQDENDDYEEQIDEINSYPYNKNGQNLSTHDSNRKKLDNTSDSSQDENDDYEEQMDETVEYPNNKNSQNLPIHGGNQRKLDNISDSSQDENDDYEEQMDETTRYPRYPKDKNNQNLSMHGGNQKKLDNNSDSSQDENDEYKDSDFLPSGRANKKKERELYEEQIDETTRYSKNKNNQKLSMHQKKLDNDRDSSQDENDEYKNSDLLPSGRANKKKERELYEEQIDETTRYSKNKNNQKLSMHGGNQKKLDNDRDSSQDENDEYKNSDLLPSGRANKKKERELYEEQIDETTRYSKNKNNQNLSMHNDNRNELNYNDNVGDSQKYSRSNKRNESESFYGGSRKEITNNQNNQSSYRDNNKDYYNSNNQEKNRKPDNSSSIWPGVINRWMPGSNKDENEIKVIFHVHFPEGIDKVGNPVVLGNVKELGSWKSPIVKLIPQNRTYWRSDQIVISLSSVVEEIQYKYAIHIPKSIFRGREERIVFEGSSNRDDRMLNIGNNQFDIFISNNQLPRLYPNTIRDFAFMYSAILTLVQHNAFRMQFNWVLIFTIASEVDSNFDFIDYLKNLKYSDDKLLANFIKAIKMIRPYIDGIEAESYIKIAKWLIQLCHNMDYLIVLWNDILLHNNELDKVIFKCFIERIREKDSLNWGKEEIIQSLDLISQSNTLELLNIFPVILDDWFNGNFSDTKEKKIPKICMTWFKNLLIKIDTGTSARNRKENNIVLSVFLHLERIHPLLGHRKNVWQSLTTIAIDRVRVCSEPQIFGATKFIIKMKEQAIQVLFLDLIKEMLSKAVQQINDQLINKIYIICDCNKKTLEVPNTVSEEILYHIITRLQNQSSASDPSEHHLNILRASQFWSIILRATGNVTKLHSNPFVQRVKKSINELGGLLREKKIDIQLLQQLLEFSDEKLFQHFDAAVSKKKAIVDVIVSRDEIAELRKLCGNFQLQLDILFKFYNEFCPVSQVTDVDDYIQDVKKHMASSNNVFLREVLSPDYWAFHEKTLIISRHCYKYIKSRSFRNIFEDCIKKDTAATNVDYIAQKLIPAVFKEYNTYCEQFKKWEKLEVSYASLFWHNVTDVNMELDLMDYKGYKNQEFLQTINHLSKIPHWINRLEELDIVVKLFKIAHDKDDWLIKSLKILSDGHMKLNQINDFFNYLNNNISNVDQECWKLIKELSNADEFISFLEEIVEHDIKNLINGVDDHSDERLVQEDTVSSLIQVKQILLPFMNKNKRDDIAGFLASLSNIIKKNPTLGEKIALCNSCHMALRNMYKNISDRGEVTKEKIKNAVLNGSYTFGRDEKEDKCFVTLKYTSRTFKSEMLMTYNMNEILDLRGRALLIAKPKISVINDKDDEISKNILDEFTVQVDIAQEIINVVSVLMQLGHFDYRRFENELMGTDRMKDYLKFLKNELKNWQTIVDHAQEQCYYLTFFPARHILAFHDYFTSEKLDEENEEECKTLVRFVNNKAKLPFRKDVQGISRGSKDYRKILCEIGNELEKIFKKIPKQSRGGLKAVGTTGQRATLDIVKKGKLFIAACADKTRVPNIIMSLYANNGNYPEPWQLLICTTSTTMEELTIFIKRSFFASKNGYENHLFCIANLELLDFELQYDLVNQIRSMRDQKDFLLALICYRENGIHHHILDQFSSDVVETNGLNNVAMRGIYKELCKNVICISSDLSGQGKTEWIKEDSFNKKRFPRSFLISDDMEFGRLVRQFKECKLRPAESLHINIVSSNFPGDVNMFLFELLTLGIVSTNVNIACLPLSETPTYIFIEIASTTEQYLLNSLPMAGYLLSKHLTWDIKSLKISQDITSPIQVTCNYLNLLDLNEIDTKEILFRTDDAIKEPLPVERCQNLIEKYFFNENNKDISSFRFVEIFVNVLADQLVRFSSSLFFTVDNLRLMVKETTNIRKLILKTLMDGSKDFATRSIKTREAQLESTNTEDENARLGTIVQWDDSNHLIVFFNSQTPDTISALYRDRTKVHENVKTLLKSQVIGDRTKWELDDYNSMSTDALLVKLEYLARRSTEKLNISEYALSGDNLIKMALILLRARANIPVIVCGEAGCGKTSLIAYLALMVEVQFQSLNLHAGIDEKTIMMFMDDSLEKAEKGEIWLFFDEINTCNYIGLLSDLISHRMLNGKLIHPNIRLFSACNPYRLRTKTQSEAGLTNRVKKFEERSNLVYQVKPLPDQILDYVWDYGILKPKDEYRYIQIMVEKELKNLAHPVFAELLFASQNFIRKVEEPYSVSLRDVKRAIKLVIFFYKSLHNRPAYRYGHVYPPPGNPTILIRSYVLALSLCYHSRLYEQDLRRQYRYEMGQILHNHNAFVGENMFSKIIREEQEDYIKRMRCPPNTAYNEALLENVLVMIVCILTKIPLFLIGAPGSSKSLAIRLISSNLRGADSYDKYFRNLPQIYLIPHQGSSSSTSDGIIKVFDKANRFQETTSTQFPVISVVLLDEVGLAETSPYNPLKVLHSLLEPSYPATGPTVSVIGISNWRLDNSKSSRALLVQRPQFDLDDLVDTAERLLNKRVVRSQRGALRPLAKAYLNYEKHGQSLPNFHGLRDYYALVKRLSLCEMTPENIQMALSRNFGGTENHVKLCELYFGYVLKMFNNHKPWLYKQIPIEQLITSNLDDSDARHLMVIGKSDSIVNLLTYQLRMRDLDPVVILGSQFPDDRDDYYYSVLRRIMMCVETGRPLILTDLEIIYGSLYDLWNQNYIVVGSKDNVKYFTRVALGAYANPMLYVSPNFKCILVMDEKNMASADPPLLNRFEKQKMSINDTLNNKQKLLVENLGDWVRKMSTLIGVNPITQLRNKFTQKNLFIGFDKDETLQSLIIDITKNNPEADNDEILEKCKECLIATASSDGVVRAEQSALERDEVDRWKQIYFHKQHHNSLYDYFANQEDALSDPNGHLVIINTFSNINTDVKSCLQELASCQVDKLSIFKTEAQLSNRVKHFWSESTDQMLILQCDLTTVNTGCIKLAKFIIEQFRNEYISKRDQMERDMPTKHACIILHIHRDQESTFTSFNFMCGWKQMTIETLSGSDVPTSGLLDGSLTRIVNSTYPFEKILQQELLWCLSCMKYPSNDKSINHIKTLNEKILKHPIFIECLKKRVLEWAEENSTSDWQYKIASNKQNLYPYPSFSAALQAHVRTLFRTPIARILCALERLSAIKTFFYVSDQTKSKKGNYEKLLKFWEQIYVDEKIIKIEDIQNPKPDGYNMPAGSLLDLEFPFSFYYMKQIDSFKRHYEEEISMLQKDDDKIDDETNELYDDVIEDHLKDFKNNLLTSIPQLKNSPLEWEWASELYFNDFVTVIASKDGETKNRKMLALILKLLIGADKMRQPIFLHAYWWKNANEVLAQLQLAQMSPIIIKNIEKQGNSIVRGSIEKYLVKEVTKLMLQRICGNFEVAENAHLIDKWQHDVTKVLSLVNKITRAKNLPDLQLLRIINDLVATKTIPLESIREIVQLGLSSDEQEVLSEEFINTVIDKLDKLEQNEKNIIPKRSFIMRCLALIPIESDVLLSFYKKLFSNEPFPLMGAIIERVFIKEDLENQDIFFTTLTDFDEAMRQSTRLNIINECLGDLNTNMTTLCCDTIEQSFFMNEKLENLAAYCGSALEALYKQGRPSLQKIVSIALLKEFVRRFWDSFLPKNKNNPIVYDKAEENNFDNEIINQINNILTFSHPLIHSLKIYFLRDLFRRGFSIDDIRRFCEAQKNVLPWLRTFNWEDTKENRLSDNPYCNLPEYNEAENSFMALYSIGNKAPFQTYIQQMKQNMTLTTKLSLMGLLFVRLHALRASREWRHSEVQSADFLTKEITGMNLSNSFKTIATNILSNKQPLLQIINPEINNTDLILKSVIAHIIAFHASIEPNSSQLAMYLHNLQDCQNKFILTCMSDMESVLLNAINEKVTRYVCKCGFKYFVANCGNVVHASKCPNCGNTIGGNAYNQPAAGNTRLDVAPGGQASNDQVGYIGELVNQDLGHSVRSFPPTTYRMLHLIIHALIGASSPQPALVFLQKNNNIATDSEKYCMDHIRNDWEVLKKLLNCSDVNLALIFHSLISLMMENPPLPNQQTNTSAERMNWETVFHNNYVTPQTKNVNETAANYRMKLNEALTKNKKINLIECEINQTLVMDEQYRSEKLPNLWRTIGIINFDSFRAYYMSDLTRNNDYPFLNIFFKHSKQIELLKHLLPIVKFVQILNAKLGYQLTRQTAKDMNFRQFIEKESNGGENDEIFNSLNTAFNDFKLGWNTVMPFVKRYQCHELPNDKPTMGYNLPVIFGLLEQKDAGIFLCAILYHLIEIQNRFLQEVIEIPPGTCKSLKFLDELTFDVGLPISKTKPVTPNGYCLQSMYLDHARSGNIINFDWDDEILAYSQRNLAIARGEDIVYDLTKIEAELANILVFEKVYIETLPDSQLYLEPFPYHMELFQGCMRILSDIKNLIAQEPIPIEKMNLLGVSSLHYASKLNLDNASELLSSLEILLCFVKRTAAGDGEKSIKEFVLQWMKLSSLYEHRGFSKILDTDLQLKHLVSLYELVEEQVADIKIKYIHEKYKEKLSADMETAIMKSLDLEQQTTTKKVIPAEAFALALKRFMLRFLTLENQKEKEPLYVYLQDSSLNFWPSTVPEELIDELFPENLLLANTYDAYTFTINKIEQTMKKQANFTRNIVNNQTIKSPNNQKEPTASKSTQRRSRKILSKYDAM